MARSKYTITAEMLEGACAREVAIFNKEWPDGAVVTLKNIKRAAELGINIDWAALKFLPKGTHWEFLKANRPAWEEYLDDYTTGCRLRYFKAIAPILWKVIQKHGLNLPAAKRNAA